MLLLFVGASSDTLIVGIGAIAASALTNYLVSARSAAKFEGAANARLTGVERDISLIRVDDRDQWTHIHSHSEQIGELKGRWPLHSKSHHV